MLKLRDRNLFVVEGEKTSRRVERTFGCSVDISFVQTYPGVERSKRGFSQFQHLRGRIDSIEAPTRVSFGESLQFQSSTRAEDQHSCIIRSALRE
jgi:hypothetical protein